MNGYSAEVAEESTICDRLRGVYTVPVNDGAGLLNGKDTHTRTFPVAPIQLAAADLIDRLRAELALALTAPSVVGPAIRARDDGGVYLVALRARPIESLIDATMTIEAACEVAELAAPVPAIAAGALRVLRRALDDQRQRRDLTVLSLFWCLQEIKRALGLSLEHPVAGVPELVAKLRRDAAAAGVV